MTGKKNPAYKDGRRSYRNVAKAKPGQHVHHKDGNSSNNSKGNLEKFPAKGPGRAAHEKNTTAQIILRKKVVVKLQQEDTKQRQ